MVSLLAHPTIARPSLCLVMCLLTKPLRFDPIYHGPEELWVCLSSAQVLDVSSRLGEQPACWAQSGPSCWPSWSSLSISQCAGRLCLRAFMTCGSIFHKSLAIVSSGLSFICWTASWWEYSIVLELSIWLLLCFLCSISSKWFSCQGSSTFSGDNNHSLLQSFWWCGSSFSWLLLRLNSRSFSEADQTDSPICLLHWGTSAYGSSTAFELIFWSVSTIYQRSRASSALLAYLPRLHQDGLDRACSSLLDLLLRGDL